MKQNKPKPWYRARNVFLVIVFAIVAFIGWAFIEVWQVYSADPNPAIDYRAKLNELAHKDSGVKLEEADNTWNILQSAIDIADKVYADLDSELVNSSFEQRYDWDAGEIYFPYLLSGDELPTDIERERLCLSRMRDKGMMNTLEQFSERLPGLRPFSEDNTFLFFTLPSLSRAMNLVTARLASMRLALADRDFEESTIAFEQLLAIATTVSVQPTLLDYLVCLSIQSRTMAELRYELMETEFNEQTCRRMLESIEQFQLADISYCIESQRLTFHDLIQLTFSDNGNGNGFLIPGNNSWKLTFNDEHLFRSAIASRFYYADRNEVLKRYDHWVDGYLHEVSLLPIERWQNDFDPTQFEKELSARHRFLSITLPAFGKVMLRENIQRIQQAGTRIMLGIEIYHAINGKYPNKLDELTTSILPDLPNDPFHNGPFGYRLLINDPHDRPYLLYSTGPDRHDDGGKEPSGIHADYWGPEGIFNTSLFPNHDYIINTTRPEEF